jgi:acyl carrier protein
MRQRTASRAQLLTPTPPPIPESHDRCRDQTDPRWLRPDRPRIRPYGDFPNENIRRALDIDSFDFLNFLIILHEKLGVDIPEADYGKLNTLDEMVAYLAARTK